MSWSASASFRRHETTEQDLAEIQAIVPTGNDQAPKERDVQVEAAKHAAIELLQSPVFDSSLAVSVYMGGHANLDHKPTAGYANDTVTITITQTE